MKEGGKMLKYSVNRMKNNLKQLICQLTTLSNILILGKYISGHDFILYFEDDYDQILKCKYCGYESIGIKKERSSNVYKKI